MGKMRCEKHGMRGVVLTCRHVKEAVYTKPHVPVEYKRVVQDFLGDGKATLSSLVCSQCIQAFNIDPEKLVPVDEHDLEHKKFPYTAPICAQCLAEYEEVHIE
jgi:hypothetical protein